MGLVFYTVVGLTSSVSKTIGVHNRTSGDDYRIVRKGIDEGKESYRRMVRVHIVDALLPHILLCLSLSQALSACCFLLLVLAILMWQLALPLLQLPLRVLLLLEL